MIKKIKRLDIIHEGRGYDGYPTTVNIDGMKFPDAFPGLYEESIVLLSKAGEPVRVFVKCNTGESIEFQPKEFDLTIGDIRIAIDSQRCPCKVTIGPYEPQVTKLIARFAEGEAVSVRVHIMPDCRNKSIR